MTMGDLPGVYVDSSVGAVCALHTYLYEEAFRRQLISAQLQLQAESILTTHQCSDDRVAFHITCWHARLVGRSADEILSADFTMEDARMTIARAYGFDGWSELTGR